MSSLFIIVVTVYLMIGAGFLFLGRKDFRAQIEKEAKNADPYDMSGTFAALYVITAIYAIVCWPFCVKIIIEKKDKPNE